MSFNSDLKTELASASFSCPDCIYAECLGMMLYAGKFSSDGIKLQLSNPSARKRVMTICRQVFGVPLKQDGNVLTLTGEENLCRAFEAFGYEYDRSSLQLNRALVENECCKNAFIRGILLTGGNASAPEKSYHLEIVTSHYHVARQTATLLSEMGLAAGYVLRRGNHILYFKGSSTIEDILTMAGAPSSAMNIMVVKIERELINKINRRVNFETANLDKTIAAAAIHIDAINKLEKADKLSTLPPAIQETARLRREYPELSLGALCEKHSEPISRPGLNTRLKKLIKLAEELEI